MNLNLDNLLNLPRTIVISSEKVSDFYLLQLRLTNQGISCPHCKEYSEILHQTKHIGSPLFKAYHFKKGRAD